MDVNLTSKGLEFAHAAKDHSASRQLGLGRRCVSFSETALPEIARSSLLLQNRAVSVPDQLGPHSFCVLDVRERSQLHAKQLVRCWRRNECRIFFFLQRIDERIGVFLFADRGHLDKVSRQGHGGSWIHAVARLWW